MDQIQKYYHYIDPETAQVLFQYKLVAFALSGGEDIGKRSQVCRHEGYFLARCGCVFRRRGPCSKIGCAGYLQGIYDITLPGTEFILCRTVPSYSWNCITLTPSFYWRSLYPRLFVLVALAIAAGETIHRHCRKARHRALDTFARVRKATHRQWAKISTLVYR